LSSPVQRITDLLAGPKFILGLGLAIVATLCVYPFLNLFYEVLTNDAGLSGVIEHFGNPSTLSAIKNTLIVSVGSAVCSALFATPLAWVLSRSDLRGASRWRSLFCLPYAIPPYIGAIAWIVLANPANGILNELFGIGALNIYSLGGLIWVMCSFEYTLILLSLLSALDRMDSSLEEAARMCGASPASVFFRITLPLILPSLLSGVLLVALSAAASFGVPAMIGNPARIYLLTTKIYTFQKMGSMSGVYKAGTLSLVLLSITCLILLINHFIKGKGSVQTVTGKSNRLSPTALGKYGLLVQIVLGGIFTVLFLLPLFGISLSAFSKIQGKYALDNLTFNNFYRIFFSVDETWRAIGNSFAMAAAAATFATLLGVVLAFIQEKTRLKGRNLLDVAALIPYSTPGTIVALAIILAFSRGFLGINLYNSIWILCIAYVVKYLCLGLRTARDAYSQIHDSLAEAARVSGASWGRTWLSIWIPMLKPAIVAGWFFIFMPSFSELTMTVLLSGPGIETIGTLLFQLQEYSDTQGGGAAVLSTFIIASVAISNFMVKKFSRGKYGL
jgi:iron(III) transport system permease protein